MAVVTQCRRRACKKHSSTSIMSSTPSVAADHTATVWDLARMKAEQKLRGHAGPIHGVIVVHDLALTTSQDKTIKVWDLRLQTCAMTFSRLLIGFAVCGLGGEV